MYRYYICHIYVYYIHVHLSVCPSIHQYVLLCILCMYQGIMLYMYALYEYNICTLDMVCILLYPFFFPFAICPCICAFCVYSICILCMHLGITLCMYTMYVHDCIYAKYVSICSSIPPSIHPLVRLSVHPCMCALCVYFVLMLYLYLRIILRCMTMHLCI